MYGGREKLHILLLWVKLVSVPQESSSQTTHLLLGFNDIKELYHYEFMGWDGLWLLKIADYALFNLNQLRELNISNNAIVNLPVHVFQGLICLEEVS